MFEYMHIYCGTLDNILEVRKVFADIENESQSSDIDLPSTQ